MFATEQELVNIVTALIGSSSPKVPKTLKHKNQLILEEVDLGYGIADIVLTQCSDCPDKRDVFLRSQEIKILHMVKEYRAITIDRIVTSTGISKSNVHKHLKCLEGLKLVKETNDIFSLWKPYVNVVKRSIAIEAKLFNWKRALKQAYRYKWFSEKSYVCLPSGRTTPALNNLKLFVDMGVGLLEVSEEEGIKVLHDPRSQRPICKEMNTLLNEHVLTRLHASL